MWILFAPMVVLAELAENVCVDGKVTLVKAVP